MRMCCNPRWLGHRCVQKVTCNHLENCLPEMNHSSRSSLVILQSLKRHFSWKWNQVRNDCRSHIQFHDSFSQFPRAEERNKLKRTETDEERKGMLLRKCKHGDQLNQGTAAFSSSELSVSSSTYLSRRQTKPDQLSQFLLPTPDVSLVIGIIGMIQECSTMVAEILRRYLELCQMNIFILLTVF